MKFQPKFLSFALALAIGWLAGTSAMNAAEKTPSAPEANKQLIRESFDRWRAGTGGPFELLAEDATWTITGNSVVAKKYATREEFLSTVIRPFNARVTKPLVPTVRSLHCDGDTVIALFDGEATARDGKPYRNTYAWFMEIKDGKIVTVTAFFDAIVFDEFWKRVAPKE
ncbi:nuclear transport factor 2 family protein [Luteolibacter arcticus]|uniref:Nuclear transport factor 2 family protein n=1 Tax=Luteolibacter arcticus TaxID=1581411 RepID=A0ABT3GFQ0_9BACT|nr:nuclear transport factor 2 family protein [Luteolibacter arcticus]MCW1922454.1 nuclear transport factor 2 family protein [Luteolibacter arcticus]